MSLTIQRSPAVSDAVQLPSFKVKEKFFFVIVCIYVSVQLRRPPISLREHANSRLFESQFTAPTMVGDVFINIYSVTTHMASCIVAKTNKQKLRKQNFWQCRHHVRYRSIFIYYDTFFFNS